MFELLEFRFKKGTVYSVNEFIWKMYTGIYLCRELLHTDVTVDIVCIYLMIPRSGVVHERSFYWEGTGALESRPYLRTHPSVH